jgi:hypothetical protein
VIVSRLGDRDTLVVLDKNRERYAIETWFFAPSAYPDGQIPLVF